MRGTVTSIYEDLVKVKFEVSRHSSTANVKYSPFTTTYDPVDKITLTKRNKIPLKVAFAITIDKSHWLSLNRVMCQNCTQPGQLWVEVARPTSIDGP